MDRQGDDLFCSGEASLPKRCTNRQHQQLLRVGVHLLFTEVVVTHSYRTSGIAYHEGRLERECSALYRPSWPVCRDRLGEKP